MKRFLVLLFLLTIVLRSISQDKLWHNTIGGTGTITPLKSVVDQNNNIYIIGSFTGNIKYTGVIDATASGSSDGYLAKFKSNGTLDWVKVFSSTGLDEVRAIAVDPSNQHIYVGGSFQYTCSFTGGSNLTVVGTASASNFDAFIAEYDTSGNYQSVIPFAKGGAGDNTGQFIESMKVDNSGTIFACGYYKDNIYFTSGSLTGIATNQNYIGRFNKNGSAIWVTKVAGTTNSDRALIVDISGDASYWAGHYSNTISFNTTTLTNTAGGRNMFLLKTDLNGIESTYREVKGSADELTSSLSVSSEGVFWGGYFNTAAGGITIDSTATTSSNRTKSNSLGGYDFIYLKYNQNLNLECYHVSGSTGSSTANDDFLLRAVFGKGFFVVSGKFGGNVNLGSSTLNYGGGTGTDMFGLVLDKFDNLIYAIPFAGNNVDVGRTAVIDNLGNYVFIGDFKSPDFKINGVSVPLDGTNSDLVIVKYKKGSLDKFSSNVTCNGNANGSISVFPKGSLTPPYTYVWDKNSIIFSPSDPQNLTNLTPGTYTLNFNDSEGFTIKEIFNITEPALPISVSVLSQTNVNCYGNATGSVTLSGAGGTPPYTYNKDGGAYQSSPIFSLLRAATYTFGIKGANGCTSTVNVTITEPLSALSLTMTGEAITILGNDGKATATPTGGTSPYTYSWNPTGQIIQTAIGLSAGTYTATVTDSKTCQVSGSIGITLMVATTTKTDITCFGTNNGTATVTIAGGTAPYSYELFKGGISQGAPGSSNFFSWLTAANNYSVTVRDATTPTPNSASTSFTIIEPATLTATLNRTDITCSGFQDGSIETTITGGTAPYSYAWTKNAVVYSNTANIFNLAYGGYQLTVTDKNSCPDIKSSTLSTTQSNLTVNLTPTNANCYLNQGNTSGSISSSVTGGSGGYTYLWNNGKTTSGITANPGNYTLTVQDALSCSASANSIINYGPQITGNIDVIATPCAGSSTGSLKFTPVLSGNGGLSYLWNNAQSTQTISNLIAGGYSVTVADSKNCQYQPSTTLIAYTLPTASMSGTTSICTGGSTLLTITLTGTAPWNVTYNAGSTPVAINSINTSPHRFSVSPTSTTVYSITSVSDFHCNGTNFGTSATVTLYSALSGGTISGDQTICSGGDPAPFISSTDPSGGSGSWTYSWESLVGSGSWTAITGSNSLTYDVPAGLTQTTQYRRVSTNSCGAINSTNTITITVNPIPTVTLSAFTGVCAGSSAFTLTGGSPVGGTYSGTGVSGSNFIPLTAGVGTQTITYSFTNSFGCTNTASSSITVNALPIVDIAPGVDTVKIKTNEQHTFDAGAGFASYKWNDGTSNQTLAVNGATFNPGNYTYWVEVSNVSGCIARDTVILNVSWPTSVNTDKDWSITIFPNPTKGEIKLNLSGLKSDKVEITIHNSVGMVVFQKEFRTNSSELHELINLEKNSKGIYLLKITDNKMFITRKIILE